MCIVYLIPQCLKGEVDISLTLVPVVDMVVTVLLIQKTCNWYWNIFAVMYTYQYSVNVTHYTKNEQ
jgi:hypothetical protein